MLGKRSGTACTVGTVEQAQSLAAAAKLAAAEWGSIEDAKRWVKERASPKWRVRVESGWRWCGWKLVIRPTKWGEASNGCSKGMGRQCDSAEAAEAARAAAETAAAQWGGVEDVTAWFDRWTEASKCNEQVLTNKKKRGLAALAHRNVFSYLSEEHRAALLGPTGHFVLRGLLSQSLVRDLLAVHRRVLPNATHGDVVHTQGGSRWARPVRPPASLPRPSSPLVRRTGWRQPIAPIFFSFFGAQMLRVPGRRLRVHRPFVRKIEQGVLQSGERQGARSGRAPAGCVAGSCACPPQV